MRKSALFSISLLLASLFLLGCTSLGGEGTEVEKKESNGYSVSMPKWQLSSKPDYSAAAIEQYSGRTDVAGRQYSISVARLPLQGATLQENAREAEADIVLKYNAVEQPVEGLQNKGVNRFGANDWHVLCYSYYEDGENVRDACNAISLCNGEQVVATLSSPHQALGVYLNQYRAVLTSFECKQ